MTSASSVNAAAGTEPSASAGSKDVSRPVSQAVQPTKAAEPSRTLHQHQYVMTLLTSSTCGAEGLALYECSCGDNYTEALPATGEHVWVHDDAQYYESPIWESHVYCNSCNKDFGTGSDAAEAAVMHGFIDPVNNKCGSYRSAPVTIGTELVEASPACDMCTVCGAIKGE